MAATEVMEAVTAQPTTADMGHLIMEAATDRATIITPECITPTAAPLLHAGCASCACRSAASQTASRPGLSSPPAPPIEPVAPRSVKLEFGSFERVEDLASRLEAESNRWCLDMHHNYRHNPDFVATYADAYKVFRAAKFVHAAEHRQDREAIRDQVAQIETLFHDVQERTSTWTREERRPVGRTDINGKAAAVESIVHHLLFDAGIEVDHSATQEEQAPPPADLVPLDPLPAAR